MPLFPFASRAAECSYGKVCHGLFTVCTRVCFSLVRVLLLFLYRKEEYFMYKESIPTATSCGSRNPFD